MNFYAIFGFGLFVGVLLGFIIAALLGAAHHGDRDTAVTEAYQDGFKEGHALGFKDGLSEWQKVG